MPAESFYQLTRSNNGESATHSQSLRTSSSGGVHAHSVKTARRLAFVTFDHFKRGNPSMRTRVEGHTRESINFRRQVLTPQVLEQLDIDLFQTRIKQLPSACPEPSGGSHSLSDPDAHLSAWVERIADSGIQ